MSAPRRRISEDSNEAESRLELFDPRRGDPSFSLCPLRTSALRSPIRTNYFTILWIHRGCGVWHVGSTSYDFNDAALLFANPYQTTLIRGEGDLSGTCLRFHANFFCIETHHAEIGCNGVLFNNLYGTPVLPVDNQSAAEFQALIESMTEEHEIAGLAHSEILLSYLKVLLIKATRIRLKHPQPAARTTQATPEILTRLVELVEIHYREKHRPLEYARLLGISEKALNKTVRAHFQKSLTHLIRERILNHAKWHLLHTQKTVKEIGAEAGFTDEFYFSRLFKRATGMAPTVFREFETQIRGGRNLSM